MMIKSELHRFSPTSIGNIYLQLTTVRENYGTWWYREVREYTNGHHSQSLIIYVTKGLGGKMIDVSTNGQMKTLEADSDFKELVDCIKKGKKFSMMHPLSGAIEECIGHDPTYHSNAKSVIPPVN